MVLTGSSTSPEVCWASACRSMGGASSTILWTDIWMNSSKESSCCRTRPFSSKYELEAEDPVCFCFATNYNNYICNVYRFG